MSTAPTTASVDTPPEYFPQDLDWLAEAQRIASLYEAPDVGRPADTLTDIYRLHKLLKLVAAGNYLQPAVRAAGFAGQTLYNWREQAKTGNIAAIALIDALENAEASAETEIVSNVRNASKLPQFWAAGMTLISRRHRERWQDKESENSGPRVVVQIGVADRDVKVNIISATPQVPDVLQLSQATEPPLSEAKGSRTHPDPQSIIDVSPQLSTHLAPHGAPVSAVVLERKPLTNAAPGESGIGGARSAGGPTGQRRPSQRSQRLLVQRRRLARLKKKAKDAKGLA